MQEESGRLKEATPRGFLALFDSFQYSRKNISECSFLPLWRSVYTSNMEVQKCPVLEVQQCDQTHKHKDRNFSKPFTTVNDLEKFKRGGSIIDEKLSIMCLGLLTNSLLSWQHYRRCCNFNIPTCACKYLREIIQPYNYRDTQGK